MFHEINPAPPDPILGLTETFKADPNPDKINLGVGVYQDANGQTPVLACVRQAEKRLAEAGAPKSYLPIAGSPEYGQAVRRLIFGPEHSVVQRERAQTALTPGGTGALRVAADFLKIVRPEATVWVSDPTWANHKGILAAAGLPVSAYPYYDAEEKCLAIERMLEALSTIPKGDVVLLHGACHNPTGMDPNESQWRQIAEIVRERALLPLIDFAYQGFASGLDEDAAGARLFCEDGQEALVASSYSKNFGLYCERVGALTLVAASSEDAAKAFTHVKIAIRRNYSNPPAHGGAIVTAILNDASLRETWMREVGEMRERINSMRALFNQTMASLGASRDFSFIERQNGMFSFSGLTPEQAQALREKDSIYIVNSGRINVAGITPSNVERLCQAIAAVL